MPKRLKAGQPPKISAKVTNEIVYALQTGASYKIAAQYAGISYDSLRNWTLRGEAEFMRWQAARNELLAYAAKLGYIPTKFPKKLIKACRITREERIYFQFFKQVEGAKGIAAAGWLKVIDTSAQMDADWAAWMLARRYPDEFGPNAAKLQLSSAPDQPLIVDHTGLVSHNHGGMVAAKVEFNDLSAILGILAEAGALEPGSVQPPAGEPDAAADEVHPDPPSP